MRGNHKHVRRVLGQLSLPAPLQKHFSSTDWRLDLSDNTNPYGDEWAGYPDALQEPLKKLYLQRILALEGITLEDVRLSTENVLFTVGSLEGIDILLRTLAEPGKDRLCVPHPTFSAYAHWGQLYNLAISKISLEGDQLTELSSEDILRSQPRLIFLCTPNNPTGTLLNPDIIPALCEGSSGFVVVDEAYMEFTPGHSCLPLLERYENLIILRTFSKAWGLAGVRCGAILARSEIIQALRYSQLPFGFSMFAQDKVRSALEGWEEKKSAWETLIQSRESLRQQLLTLSSVEKVFNSQANFLFLILKDFEKVMKLLQHHHILVSDWSSVFPKAIRVSIGLPEHNAQFLEVMRLASS